MSNRLVITFVHVGEKAPHHLGSSLRLAARFSGCSVRLLASEGVISSLGELPIETFPLEDFYDSTRAQSISGVIRNPHAFRNGFWLKSLERLFVLEQFMAASGLERLIHVESDQLIFRIDQMHSYLEGFSRPAVCFPMHSNQMGVASVLVINQLSALQSLTDFAQSSGTYANEMEVLAEWARSNPATFERLPTLSEKTDTSFSTNDGVMGQILFDAIQLGAWVAGVDPRNTPLKSFPQSRFHYEEGSIPKEKLETLRFTFEPQSPQLKVHLGDHSFGLMNLHLHSKIHPYLESRPGYLQALTEAASVGQTRNIPGGRIRQIRGRLADKAVRNWTSYPARVASHGFRLLHAVGLRPSSAPYLSGDTFRSLADFRLEANASRSLSLMKDGAVIFCESHRLETLREHLNTTDLKTVIILGNSDRNFFDEDLFTQGWKRQHYFFVQNLAVRTPFAEVLPIGLENIARLRNGFPHRFKGYESNPDSRRLRIMWSFKVETNFSARNPAVRDLQQLPHAEYVGTLSPRTHSRVIHRYAFVACPPGNGLDTHRVWEAIYAGSVPVVLDNVHSRLLSETGFPVHIVDSFRDMESHTVKQLKSLYLRKAESFEEPAIWFPWWQKRIQEASGGFQVEG